MRRTACMLWITLALIGQNQKPAKEKEFVISTTTRLVLLDHVTSPTALTNNEGLPPVWT